MSGRPHTPRPGAAEDRLASVPFQADAAGRWTALGPAWATILGRPVQASLGRPLLDCVYPHDRARCHRLLKPLLGGTPASRRQGTPAAAGNELRFMARDGSTRWMKVLAHALPRHRGGAGGIQGTLTDITPLLHAEAAQRLAASVFEGSGEGIVITDAQARIVEVNAAFVAITGYTREQVLGRNPSMLSSGRHGTAFYRAMWQGLRRHGRWRGEVWNRRADGEPVAEMLHIQAVHSPHGELVHYVGTFSDITVLKRQQERLQWLTHFDALTELPNRLLVLDRLARLLAEAQRRQRLVAVCCLDLDGFNVFNRRHGRTRGDALLRGVAARISQAVRGSDTVGRLGGDEFVLLLHGLQDAAAVHATLERVRQGLAQPFDPPLPMASVTASIGVALYPAHGASPGQLLRAAGHAMYRAKRLGRDRVCLAGSDTERPPVQDGLLEELRLAMAAGQLCLHYQPRVCARTRQPRGAEALVRWQHPRRGLLAPGAFLPAIAGTPLEVELDLWVLRSAVAQLAHWRRAGRALLLSVNVSPGTLFLPGLADTVAGYLPDIGPAAAGAGHGIELEVLETAALHDLGVAARVIKDCAARGISFALDDFGTGYSSLSYLRRLPVHTLKIDRSFVGGMLGDAGDLHIVRAVIGLAQAFGMQIVAEGVETDAHARLLGQLGCHELQGYGIARPMPAQALEGWLDACTAGMGHGSEGAA